MKSLYGLLRERCGLSLREASTFHDVPIDTVTSWSSGRRRAPDGVIAELRALYAKIETAADNLIAWVEELGSDEEIELGIASDDADARSRGWPCVGAHAAYVGIAAASLDNRLIIAPGVTTLPTAAADSGKIRGMEPPRKKAK